MLNVSRIWGPLSPHDHEMAERMNVVLFGESGSGISSTINLLLGSDVAAVSDRAIGCTFDFQMHEAGGYNYYDTVGLSEGRKLLWRTE